ncbi:MAG: hypothetical protein E6Q25_00420 [Acinetobacter sp.]|jgi:DNA segregation ATPase FtsK/SpoIIIE-like protein|nr:MAG: hypothetical protein E6Q25_00420 [Acinetobacter sp.]
MQDEQLLRQIKDFCQDIGYVSISSLQRKFMLGYEHTKQLVDILIQQDFCEAEFTPEYGYRVCHS